MSATETPVELSILLPVRNESINLRIMLKILKAVIEVPHEVLVVYDNDGDNSVEAVQAMQAGYPNLHAVKNAFGPGVPNAIRAGVESAHGKFILLFAADEIGPVFAIEEMLRLMSDGCEFVSCTRYAHGGRRLGGSFAGGIASRAANWLFYLFSGSALTDATTGIKMFPRSLYQTLALEAKAVGWSIAFEMAMKAQLTGCKLGEVPIVSIDRMYGGGKSTFRLGSWLVGYMKWFVWGSLRLRKKSGWTRPACKVRLPFYLRERKA